MNKRSHVRRDKPEYEISFANFALFYKQKPKSFRAYFSDPHHCPIAQYVKYYEQTTSVGVGCGVRIKEDYFAYGPKLRLLVGELICAMFRASGPLSPAQILEALKRARKTYHAQQQVEKAVR